MINHKALLWKYIHHVRKEEGVAFISSIRPGRTIGATWNPVATFNFTEEELAELHMLEACTAIPQSTR